MDYPLFLTLIARKLGTDSMFLLAYSVIMLNTDAHNPQRKGEAMSKAQFVANNRRAQFHALYGDFEGVGAVTHAFNNNRRAPDLLVLSEVIMASIYDEIQVRD